MSDPNTDGTKLCSVRTSRQHTIREHDVAIDPKTGYPTTVAVCVNCGRPQWRAESDDYKQSVDSDTDQ